MLRSIYKQIVYVENGTILNITFIERLIIDLNSSWYFFLFILNMSGDDINHSLESIDDIEFNINGQSIQVNEQNI